MFAWYRRIRNRIRYRAFDRDLRDEIDAHRAMAQADLEARGASPDEARTAAVRALGNATWAREEARQVWVAPWLESVWQDARYGARTLRRTPAYTATLVVTMTIGVFLSTALFSFLNVFALRPWAVDNAARLAVLQVERDTARGQTMFTLDEYDDIARRSTSLAAAAASRPAYAGLSTSIAGERLRATAQYTTTNYFAVLGVPLAFGRYFGDAENREGIVERVAVISHRLWQQAFGSRPDVLGQTIYFDGRPFLIIGVARAGWNGRAPYTDDLWVPLQTDRDNAPRQGLFAPDTGRCCVHVVGLRTNASSHAQTAIETTTLLRQRATDDVGRRARVSSGGTGGAGLPPMGMALLAGMVLGGSAIVVLLTGANIAHLQMARMRARRVEVQTRLALGAGRWRVVRQIVTESLLVSSFAAAISLVAIAQLVTVLGRISETDVPEMWRPDAAVLAYSIGTAIAMALAFSLGPVLRITRPSVSLASGSRGMSAGRRTFNAVLLTTQVALSAGLLTGAVLVSRALAHAVSSDVGYPIDDLTVLSLQPSSRWGSGVSGPARVEALTRALATPGLPRTILADALPFSGAVNSQIAKPGAAKARRYVQVSAMSADGFDTLGIPFVAGRPYAERADTAEVVINERLARLMWPSEEPLGQRIVERDKTYSVVGVIRDVHFGARNEIGPTLFLPAGTLSPVPGVIVKGGDRAAVERVRAVLLGIDPDMRIVSRTMSAQIAQRMGDEFDGAKAAWAGGMLALALATFGVFGVATHAVEERRREIAIRVALGATQHQVLRSVFGATSRPLLAGLVLGLAASLVTSVLLRQFLYGLSPFDPVSFVAVVAILTAAGMLATYLPARHALTVDPSIILKQED